MKLTLSSIQNSCVIQENNRVQRGREGGYAQMGRHYNFILHTLIEYSCISLYLKMERLCIYIFDIILSR